MRLTHQAVRRRDQRGASAVEYGLLVVAVAALIVVVVFAFGGMVRHTINQTCGRLASSVSGSSSCST
jgi:pilus assembly protein Flp/PilA